MGQDPYGRRKQQEERKVIAGLPPYLASNANTDAGPERESTISISWVWTLGLIGTILLVVFLHLTGVLGGGH